MSDARVRRGCEAIGAARLLRPDRMQHVFEDACLDAQLPPDHRARLVWAFTQRCDRRGLEAAVRSRDGHAGAPAIDPALLLSLWLYAVLDGVGSAREIERLCDEHAAYRWLCGRVGVNHHTLSDFRNRAGDLFDGLLTDMVVALVRAGIVDGREVVQDGTKVRAAAGASSFRTREGLLTLRDAARSHVERVTREGEDARAGADARAGRVRAAAERAARVDAAMDAMAELEAAKAAQGNRRRPQSPPRASTTDAQARRMQMGDGGTRPAYNVQVACDRASRAILDVRATNQANDYGQLTPTRTRVERRTGVRVRTQIADAGYRDKEDIEHSQVQGVACIVPLAMGRDGVACTSHRRDGPGVKAWRAGMRTPQAAALLRERSGIAETPNADLKAHRRLDRVLVRGMAKVQAMLLLGALAYNLLRFHEALLA